MFANPQRRALQIHHQEMELDAQAKTAEHSKHIHLLIEELREVLDASDPLEKFEVGALDPVVETIVRYEHRRHRYAICTQAANVMMTAQWGGMTWTQTFANPGWQPLDYPPGTRLLSGDANRHNIIVRMSNLKQ